MSEIGILLSTNEELVEWLKGGEKAVVVDTRADGLFDAVHMEVPEVESHGFPVLQVTFVDSVAGVVGPEGKETCRVAVYGHDSKGVEAATAAEKLTGAGFGAVGVFSPGLLGWVSGGGGVGGTGMDSSADGGRDLLASSPPVGAVEMDPEACEVGWTGRGLMHKHVGTLGLESGHLEFAEDGSISGGAFVLNMEDIVCTDLVGNQQLHDVLIAHLKNEDFFHTSEFPTASYAVTGSSWINGASPMCNETSARALRVVGNLTLKGITNEVPIVITPGIHSSGVWAAQASIQLDRTKFNVLYGSSSFYCLLGGHLVHDIIDIDLKLVSRPL